MPSGASCSEPAGDVLGLVVDRCVETELIDDPAALLRSAGDPDHAAAFDSRDLAGDAADAARRGRDDDRLAIARTADVEHPEVGGEPRDAERAEVGGQRGERRVEFRHAGSVRASELLDPESAVEVLPDREAGVL